MVLASQVALEDLREWRKKMDKAVRGFKGLNKHFEVSLEMDLEPVKCIYQQNIYLVGLCILFLQFHLDHLVVLMVQENHPDLAVLITLLLLFPLKYKYLLVDVTIV